MWVGVLVGVSAVVVVGWLVKRWREDDPELAFHLDAERVITGCVVCAKRFLFCFCFFLFSFLFFFFFFFFSFFLFFFFFFFSFSFFLFFSFLFFLIFLSPDFTLGTFIILVECVGTFTLLLLPYLSFSSHFQ